MNKIKLTLAVQHNLEKEKKIIKNSMHSKTSLS
jgi:hypothetical protein